MYDKMARVSLGWILCWLLLLLETRVCLATITREKGSKTAIACAFKKYNSNTTWQLRSGHDFINVTSCTFGQNICVDDMPQRFHGEVENTSDGFISRLMINNVRVNETEFRCLSKYGISTNTLEVYARPSTPVCDPVELDYTKKNLQFRCNVTKVYPSVNGVLYIRGISLSKEDIRSSHCSNEASGSTVTDGYSAECVWRISTAKLEPIKYSYFVKVFPVLLNSTGISVPNVVSSDYTLQLSSPKAAIDTKQCPVGPGVVGDKIINGTTASCRCFLESPGFPVGQTRWYSDQGIQIPSRDDYEDGSSTLLIYPNSTGQSFECRAESSLNNPHNRGPMYTPVFTNQPGAPECDPVEFDYTNGDLLFTCRAKDVHAPLKAMLYINKVAWLHEGLPSDQCYGEEHRALNLDSHSAECTWRVHALKFEPIKYKYYVKIFPVSSTSSGISLPYVASQDYTLQLSIPVAAIDHSHCPVGRGVVDGKIMTGSTATCRCVLASRGFPPGQAQWFKLHEYESLGRDNITDGSSTLDINNKSQDQSFECQAKSPLNIRQYITGPIYTPIFTNMLIDRQGYPVCDPVEFDYTKSNFLFTCRAKGVHAPLRGMLYIKRVAWLHEGVRSNYCYGAEQRALNLDSHSAECTWRVSAVNFEPIKYNYYVKIFPISSSSSEISLPYAASQDYTLQLSSPVAAIDHSHCPVGRGVVDGKIMNGSTATCRCVLASRGFPPGQALWLKLHEHKSLGRDNITDGSSTLDIYNTSQGQSYECRAKSPINIPLNYGPVYTPVFETPSLEPKPYSLRIEIVAGILIGSIGLTVITTIVIWKLRNRKRQNADMTRVVYNRPSVETHSDTESRMSYFCGSTNYLIADDLKE